jgi:CRP-like cAMP-binding protein
LVRQTLINYHGGETRHAMRLEVSVDSEVPPNKVKDLLGRAAASVDGVLAHPGPDVFLKDFGESAVIYEVRFWLDDHRRYNQTADAVRTNIWYALHRQRIRIPPPIRELHLERHRRAARETHLSNEEQRALATRELLRIQPVFKSVGHDHLKLLVARSSVHHYGRGETIIREGADGTSMFVLISGEAQVSTLRAGEPTQLALLHGGDCFGEMSLLTGEKRSASVQAISDCEVMEITKPVFAEIVALDAGLLPALSTLLATRRLQTEGIIHAATHQPSMLAEKEQEYRAGFLHSLKSFFEL